MFLYKITYKILYAPLLRILSNLKTQDSNHKPFWAPQKEIPFNSVVPDLA